eukprot:m.301823 g.301823  ORF g.301823 m.301823 type:complete len:177 (-) comp16428_c0_seq59:665-1195(-)
MVREYQIPNLTKGELLKKKKKDLTDLVKQHNLHFQIRGYSKLKKEALVEKLMSYSGKLVQVAEKSHIVFKKPLSKDVLKPTSEHIKKRLTEMTKKLAPELQKPIFAEGVEKGATKMFEKKYGKIKKKPINAPDKYLGKRKIIPTIESIEAKASKKPKRAKKKPPRRKRNPPKKLNL